MLIDNDDVSIGMGAGSSGVGGGANAESLPNVDARAVPLPSFGPPSAYYDPNDRTGYNIMFVVQLGNEI